MNPPLLFIPPPLDIMRQICLSTPCAKEMALDVYCQAPWPVRLFFWLRLRFLAWLMHRHETRSSGTEVLDFGGGSGVFLPTLAHAFDSVTLIDRDISNARTLADRLTLNNIHMVAADIVAHDFGKARFDVIVAADVLEHFRDLPLDLIRHWLKPGGRLYTSLPAETGFYDLLRRLFGKEKPHDHYHSAAQVESSLHHAGFKKIGGLYHPLIWPIFPLFYISAWQVMPRADDL